MTTIERDIGNPGLGKKALKALGERAQRNVKPAVKVGVVLALLPILIRGVQETSKHPSELKDIPGDTTTAAEQLSKDIQETWDAWAD